MERVYAAKVWRGEPLRKPILSAPLSRWISDLITLYYQTAAFTRLSHATRQTYLGILECFRAEYGARPVARLE